jgi:hypothetical protein
MFHNVLIAIAALLLMTSDSRCVCSMKTFETLNSQNKRFHVRIEGAYKSGLISKNNYEEFSSNLSIIQDFLNSYYAAITQPVEQGSPDDTQCDSMENQISDLIVGLKHTLDVQMPEQKGPRAPLALTKEARGPSPKQSMATDKEPKQSAPYVETPQDSVMTDTPPTHSAPPQPAPQQSIPNY